MQSVECVRDALQCELCEVLPVYSFGTSESNEFPCDALGNGVNALLKAGCPECYHDHLAGSSHERFCNECGFVQDDACCLCLQKCQRKLLCRLGEELPESEWHCLHEREESRYRFILRNDEARDTTWLNEWQHTACDWRHNFTETLPSAPNGFTLFLACDERGFCCNGDGFRGQGRPL